MVFNVENLKRKIHALVTRKARVLARVITRALECGRRTPFEACRQCRTLLSTQNFQQVLQFVLPTEHGMRVRVGFVLELSYLEPAVFLFLLF